MKKMVAASKQEKQQQSPQAQAALLSPSIRNSTLVHGDIAKLIDWFGAQLRPRDQLAVERAKDTLLEKHYGSKDFQAWTECDR